ncbi:MAG: metal ABC transporter substrate-binding protein [Lachnospiraceae bacterium]|nr:metal ABC transporter substrate-binding protein [Lachnospiraceae bacterium]
MKKRKEQYNKILLWGVAFLAVVLSLVVICIRSREKKADYRILCSDGPAFLMAEQLLKDTGCTVTKMTENDSPADISEADEQQLYACSAVVLSGRETEDFVKAVKATAPGLPIVVMADCHPESENPFLWMNTDFQMDCIDYVSSSLSDLFPSLEEKIAENGQEFSDAVFEEPYNKRLVITDEIEASERVIRIIVLSDACEAFSDSFGFYNIASFALNRGMIPTDGERENAVVTAKRCAEVLIFAEKKDAEFADELAEEAGATVIYMDPLTDRDSVEDYVKGLSENLDALRRYINREG